MWRNSSVSRVADRSDARASNSPMSVADVTARMAAIIGDAQEARELIALTLDRPRYWPLLAAAEELDVGDAAALLAAASTRAAGWMRPPAVRRRRRSEEHTS